MPFDQSTRLQLRRFVAQGRDLLVGDFRAQLQSRYGIYPDGALLSLDAMGANLSDDERVTARRLRERLEHLREALPTNEREPRVAAVQNLEREQAFTLLNRFAAIKLAEQRGLCAPSVGDGFSSKGFQVFERVAGTVYPTQYERYALFFGALCDDLSLELGVLFDRFSLQGLLFPREPALRALFDLLNAPEIAGLWGEDETIGWIYQYFNDEAERRRMRDESSAPRTSRELAVRNQFFTPRYVVEFLVDNTLGRMWWEMNEGQTELASRCRFLIQAPDTVFLAPPESVGEGGAEMLRDLRHGTLAPLSADTPDERQRLVTLAHCVDGHARHSWDEDGGQWFNFALEAAKDGTFGRASTQDIFDFLFLCCRADRHDGGFYQRSDEPWFLELAREIERRVGSESPPNFVPHRARLDPRHWKILDPACGSMHFGLYAFDLLERIYFEAWENPDCFHDLREGGMTRAQFFARVPKWIVEDNLWGADIDPRAAQIASLALWLRAGKSWNEREIPLSERPRIERTRIVCAQPMPGNREELSAFCDSLDFPPLAELVEELWTELLLAGEAGALLQIELDLKTEVERVRRESHNLFSLPTPDKFWDEVDARLLESIGDFGRALRPDSLERGLWARDAVQGVGLVHLCRQKFDVVLMNPPFGESASGAKEYIRRHYPRSKNDLLAAFVERGVMLLKSGGTLGAITSRTGFFLSSYTKWREEVLLAEAPPYAVADLGAGVLDTAMVETAAYCLEKR